jgi:hypothetical protein
LNISITPVLGKRSIIQQALLEGTGLKGQRLLALILLIALVYSSAVIQGTTIKKKQLNSILFALKSQRESITDVVVLAVASDSQQWVTYLDNYAAEIEQLMNLTPNKRCFYRRG